ncbi:hypothetical protein [Rothia uropygialis]|uniref:hypothetical protein n=1 Tax=Kocuria sp. 36 TaxID=1415402 RepID=UPI00101CB39E|nr:hypothetical protein [Kocuria sp. 36]
MSSSFLVASYQIPDVLGLTEAVTPRDALGDFALLSRRAFAKIILASLVDGDENSRHRRLPDARGHGTR